MSRREETWRDLGGFLGIYKVSSLGRVRSLPRISAGGHRLQGKVMSCCPCKTRPPYDREQVYVCLTKNGKHDVRLVNRLIAQAFLPNPHNFSDVWHLDGNSKNNALSNLEWRAGTKVSAAQTRTIRRSTESCSALAKKYGVSSACIHLVRQGAKVAGVKPHVARLNAQILDAKKLRASGLSFRLVGEAMGISKPWARTLCGKEAPS